MPSPVSSTPGPARVPLSRERVLAAAVALVDEGGLGALTMRALGQRLDVEAMSLYNHVANKDDILDGMVDLVVGEIDLPSDPDDWKLAMRTRATSARTAFARHPWASGLIDARQTSGPARLRYLDWVLGTLRRAGFSLDVAAHAFSVLDSYIYGFGRQQLNLSSEAALSPTEMAAEFRQAIPPDEYPYLTEMVVDYAIPVGLDAGEDFDFGLTLILDGLERLLV